MNVMISSTLLDLPSHRSKVKDAIIEQKMLPVMMEHMPAINIDAKTASINLVDSCNIYVLVLGIRYGTIFPEDDKSLTEIEFDFASVNKKEILIFIADVEHTFQQKDFEYDANSINKYTEFKAKLSDSTKFVVKFFKSPEELKSNVINSLSFLRENLSSKNPFNRITGFPIPPNPYIPHPYSLLESSNLVGRKYELGLLNEWLDNNKKPIFNIIAIGGMGKSALTWAWFNKKISERNSEFNGFIWWSFYESDASFGNFINHMLSYITEKEITDILLEDDDTKRENALLLALSKLNYLIVLDGIERILLAYSRLDAAKLSEEGLDEKTNNILHPFYSSKKISQKNSSLRTFSDIRVTLFFTKLLTQNIASKFVISSRLLPTIFDTNDFDEYQERCSLLKLSGLSNHDALALWRKYNVSGKDNDLLKLFSTFENYPMLIRALALEIKNYRTSPGNYEKWIINHPDFNPYVLDLVQVKSHVLYYAMKGIQHETFIVLKTICAFRAPIKYEILQELTIQSLKTFKSNTDLENALMELEERGLIGWNKKNNTYDSHPIVRGITWSFTDNQDKFNIFNSMTSLFHEMPLTSSWENINSIEDLSIPIEYFNALINLKRFQEAFDIFYDKLNNATNYKLNSSLLRITLLESLFEENNLKKIFLKSSYSISFTYNSLALSFDCSGNLEKAKEAYIELINHQVNNSNSQTNYCISLINFSDCLINMGRLYEAEKNLRKALQYFQKVSRDYEAIALGKLAHVFFLIGDTNKAENAYNRCFTLFDRGTYSHPICRIYSNYLHYLLRKENTVFTNFNNKTEEIVKKCEELLKIYTNYERNFITYKRIFSEYLIKKENYSEASIILNQILVRSREIQFIEEELSIIINLGKIAKVLSDSVAFEEYFKEFWDIAKNGGYNILLTEASLLNSEYRMTIDKKLSTKYAFDALHYSTKSGSTYSLGHDKSISLLKKLKAEIPNIPKGVSTDLENEIPIELVMPR